MDIQEVIWLESHTLVKFILHTPGPSRSIEMHDISICRGMYNCIQTVLYAVLVSLLRIA